MSFPKSFSFPNFSTSYHFSILFVSLLYLLLSLSFTDSNRRYQIWSYKTCTWSWYCPQQRRGVLQGLPWSPSQLRQPHVHDVCLDPSYMQRTACVQGWDGWVRSSTRRTSSVIRYLTVVCRIPTGWFNRIRKSLISLFLSGWSSQIFQISSYFINVTLCKHLLGSGRGGVEANAGRSSSSSVAHGMAPFSFVTRCNFSVEAKL